MMRFLLGRDLSHHLVRGGIDDGDGIPGKVRLDEPQLGVAFHRRVNRRIRFLRGHE